MPEKFEPKLGPVQETLMIPLLGRAVESQKPKGMLHDPKAVEMVDSFDYDFARWEKAPSLAGACLRTVMYDRLIEAFLKEHPEGTFVEIGCGLNTRFERLDNGKARWFDLDLPDVIDVRRRFFKDTDRRQMIAASVLDEDWVEQVKETGGPYFFASEAVLIYLDEPDVKRATAMLTEHFPGALLMTDTCGAAMVNNQHKHDAMKHLPKASWIRWTCDEPSALTQWSPPLTHLCEQTFMDAPYELKQKAPFIYRFLMAALPFVARKMMGSYRINLYRLAERD